MISSKILEVINKTFKEELTGLFVNPSDLLSLVNDSKFLPSNVHGEVGRYLGIPIYVSTAVPQGEVGYATKNSLTIPKDELINPSRRDSR